MEEEEGEEVERSAPGASRAQEKEEVEEEGVEEGEEVPRTSAESSVPLSGSREAALSRVVGGASSRVAASPWASESPPPSASSPSSSPPCASPRTGASCARWLR